MTQLINILNPLPRDRFVEFNLKSLGIPTDDASPPDCHPRFNLGGTCS